MMCDCMTFPETVDEFMEEYKIVDTKQIYTNGTELVPIFRMKQWFEHLSEDVQPVQTGHWIPCSERFPEEKDAGIILKRLGTSKRSEYVLATVEVKGERMTVTACTYDGEWDWKMKSAFPDYKIIAWMPLPEPYNDGE